MAVSAGNRFDAIVLGGSIEGLVAAAYLGKAGLRVVVVEGREVLGGTAETTERVPGFKFDTCLDSAGYLSPRVVRELDLTRHGLEYAPSDGPTVVPNLNGPPMVLHSDPAATRDGLRAVSAGDAERWPEFCHQMLRFAGLLGRVYEGPAPLPTAAGRSNMVTLLKLGLRTRALGRTGMLEFLRTGPMAVADLLDDWFEDDLLKGALGATAVRHLGQGPRSAGTAFTFLHNLVGGRSVPRPRGVVRGGMGHLAFALELAGKGWGVEYRTGIGDGAGTAGGLEQIMIVDEAVAGVALGTGAEITAPLVISAHDARRTFGDLVDPVQLDPEFLWTVNNIRFRGVAAKINLALSRLPDFAGAPDLSGRIIMCQGLDDLERAYDATKYGRVSELPVLEMTIPSLADPGLAPPGQHVLSIWLQYAPVHLRAGTWDAAARESLGDLAEEVLARYAPGVRETVVGREVLAPPDLEARYGLSGGHLYQGELALDQILFMRPVPGWAHYRTPVAGLYLCGPATHPGGGITGQSGLLAARAVTEEGVDS